jgi:hypothetical protein
MLISHKLRRGYKIVLILPLLLVPIPLTGFTCVSFDGIAGSRYHIYLLDGDKIEFREIIDTGNCSIVGTQSLKNSYSSMFKFGTFIALSSIHKFSIYDIADPLNIKLHSECDAPLLRDMIYSEELHYIIGISDTASIGIIDVTEIKNPRAIFDKSAGVFCNINNLATKGNLLFIAEEVTGNIIIMDLSNRDEARTLGEVDTTLNNIHIFIHKNHLYASGYDRVEIYDLSDATKPIKIKSVAMEQPLEQAIFINDTGYFINAYLPGILYVVDLSDPTLFKIDKTIESKSGKIFDFTVIADYAYLVTWPDIEIVKCSRK